MIQPVHAADSDEVDLVEEDEEEAGAVATEPAVEAVSSSFVDIRSR